MSNDHATPPGPYGPYGPPSSPNTPSAPDSPSSAHGAYGHPAPAQLGAYGHPAVPPYGQPAPPYGPPHAPTAASYPGMPAYGTHPYAMPTAVRAAQVLIFAMMGLAVVLTFVVAATVGPRPAGQFLGSYVLTIPLFVLAFLYGSARNGVRVASIVLASVQIVIALGATANRTPGGIIPLAGAIAVVSLLCQGSAGQWFRRPRGLPAAPRPPYA